MSENIIAKTLRIIGIAIIAIGVIAALITFFVKTDLILIALIVLFSSFITGILIIGFSEVITLLQQSVDKQDSILLEMKNKPDFTNAITSSESTEKKSATSKPTEKKAVSSKPTIKHKFRCENCGKMIEERPCQYCGKE